MDPQGRYKGARPDSKDYIGRQGVVLWLEGAHSPSLAQ